MQYFFKFQAYTNFNDSDGSVGHGFLCQISWVFGAQSTMGGLCCPIMSCPLYKRGSCKSSTEHVHIHRFPKNNLKIRELWEKFVSKQNGAPFKCRRKHGLCTAHFEAKWMMPSGRIGREAVPSIAPLSTKKVLCKWDMENSTLPITEEVIEASSSSPVEANSECVSAAENVSMNEEVGIPDDLSSAGEINFLEDFNIEVNSSHSPSNPFDTDEFEMLDTVEKVENAIRHEKEEALKRYQASMQKVQNLKVLLNQLKEAGSVQNKISSTSPVKKVPSSIDSSILKSPFAITVPTAPFIGSASIGDNGLPPPLFDDYN